MIVQHYSIDWISTTFKSGITDTQVRDAVSFGFKRRQWTETTARFGYNVALQHPFGHMIMSNFNRPDMGVHLSFSGRALRSLSEGGISAFEMLKWQAEQGGRVSRIDLAVDVFDHEIDLEALAVCPRVKDAPGSARKWSQVSGSDGGKTIYVGSRQSEKFLRIYDKAIESGKRDRPWYRFELELKSDTARKVVANLLTMTPVEQQRYAKGIMKALFNPDDALYQEIMAGDAVHVSGNKDTDDKTLEWLIESVAKTLAKTIVRRQDVSVWDMFTDAVSGHVIDFTRQETD